MAGARVRVCVGRKLVVAGVLGRTRHQAVELRARGVNLGSRVREPGTGAGYGSRVGKQAGGAGWGNSGAGVPLGGTCAVGFDSGDSSPGRAWASKAREAAIGPMRRSQHLD